MNGWGKWIGIVLMAMGMIGGHMLFVADGRYFFRSEAAKFGKEMVIFAERQRTAGEIQKENYKAIKRLNEETKEIRQDMEKKWLRKEIERLKRDKRKLQSRPRAQ